MAAPLLIMHVDAETLSTTNLSKRSLDLYFKNPITDVWCVCFKSEGSDEIKTWVPGDPVPEEFKKPFHLIAHNASFERLLFEFILGPRYGFALPAKVSCTMAMAGINNYPLSLVYAGEALGLEQQKDGEGKILMHELCRPPKKNTGDLFESADVDVDAKVDPKKLKRLIEYCEQDVRVESEIDKRLEISPFEQSVYDVDQKINDRGVRVDIQTCEAICKAVNDAKRLLTEELKQVTGNAVSSSDEILKLKNWIEKQGHPMEDLRSETVKAKLEELNLPADVRRALQIRQLVSLRSLDKYKTILNCVSADGRARGLFMYAGAFASGRWTSRRIQLQNLPRLTLADDEVALAVDLFRRNDLETLNLFLGDTIEIAKQMLRPMIYASVVGDWSSIELRIAAWLAGQDDLVTDLARGEDIYKGMASAIFKVSENEVSKNQRQVGKCVILGCGYGLGAKALFSQLKNWNVDGATEELAKKSVETYRTRYRKIRDLWSVIANAALAAIDSGKPQQAGEHLTFGYKGGTLAMRLPSGRCIKYHDIKVEDGEYGRELSCNAFSPTKSHLRKKIHGSLIFENACQGVARDLLAATLVRVDEAGFKLVGHVHDEILVEGSDDVAGIKKLMETKPSWAAGLPVAAEVFSCKDAGGRYTK